MNALVTVGAFVVALAVLIIIHEYGHYLVAKLAGVKVLRFSVGFGRPLWLHRAGADGTELAVCVVPLGGYVKMLDEGEGPVAPEELHRAFNRQSVWRRFAIVGAGPAANFLLAVVLYWMLFLHGVPESKPIVGAPDPGSIAAAANLQRGDTILKINDEAVASWQDVRWRLLQLAVDRQRARLEVLDRSQRVDWRTLELARFAADGFEGDPLARMGLHIYRPDVEPVIGRIVAGGVAERAGLRSGDRVIAIDGQPVRIWDELVASVRAHPGKPIKLELWRGEEKIGVALSPEIVEQNGKRFGRIGASPHIDAQAMQGFVTTVRYGPVAALKLALVRTWDTAVFSLRMLGKMLMGEVSWKNLSGPVTIADYAGQSAQLGLAAYVAFIALISISLGVLNLLPIPLLDGGHLMYYVAEIIKGSPVSERVMELGQRLGLSLLLFLMAFAFYNDINRLLSG
ncbi:MAG: RIP metalloprotease RseP [Betaproteobacteria bacterium RIFCSPLOWO2_12_FULL_65_110]|nr:MAG: RIP metalloprotease RseP [Betaproteobacteria bacterium RIFCSPLOWO2_02_FULL_65_20]OGA41836.1 MAG: RIP metalloprotease RseP [Betaproteobacteria bacterium RIFCSPLOWO2_12_FULL_65_110]